MRVGNPSCHLHAFERASAWHIGEGEGNVGESRGEDRGDCQQSHHDKEDVKRVCEVKEEGRARSTSCELGKDSPCTLR